MHLKAPDRTPMANAMLTLMHKLGLEDPTSDIVHTGATAFDLDCEGSRPVGEEDIDHVS